MKLVVQTLPSAGSCHVALTSLRPAWCPARPTTARSFAPTTLFPACPGRSATAGTGPQTRLVGSEEDSRVGVTKAMLETHHDKIGKWSWETVE